MSATDGLVANNASYVAGFTKGSLPLPPAKKVPSWLAWTLDAHAIRNAGGVASDDALRSLVISQRLLGTEEIILVTTPIAGWRRFATMPLRTKSWPTRA